MNDDDVLAAMRSSLTAVKDSLTDVHLDRPSEAITARARTRRLRRSLTGAAAAGTVLGVSLALAPWAPPGGHAASRSVHASSPAGPTGPAGARPVHVNLDAWSVNTTSSGSVKLYIRRVANVAELRRVLAEAGVPAVVYTDESCWNPDQIRNSAWSGPPAVDRGGLYLTIHPAAIPAGAEVEIVLHFFHGRVNGGGMGLAWRSHVRACPVTQSPSGS